MQDFPLQQTVISTIMIKRTAAALLLRPLSIKKLKSHLKDWVLNPQGWHLSGDLSGRIYDIRELDDKDDSDNIFSIPALRSPFSMRFPPLFRGTTSPDNNLFYFLFLGHTSCVRIDNRACIAIYHNFSFLLSVKKDNHLWLYLIICKKAMKYLKVYFIFMEKKLGEKYTITQFISTLQ